MSDLQARIARIYEQLPPHVRLIAVTKQVAPDIMRAAYGAGLRDFGESKLQEALEKQQQLQDLSDIRWHFIGHLQTNKAKKAIAQFEWIHAVDSLKLAQRLNDLAAQGDRHPKLCLQVKPLEDPQKYGWPFPQLLQELPQLEQCTHLDIQGLMTILPLGLSESESLAAFRAVGDLAAQIIRRSPLTLGELSMGMSGDYRLAVQAGATMVRLGRILFGDRPQTP
ncbi:MAG: YggS family pyridoxal phosphate-dependent enzyme [Chloroflexaceae bacterium]|nr:YggS family pyridoxal phosphate-dependent enzyme [Chloroflexaceae bacterium]